MKNVVTLLCLILMLANCSPRHNQHGTATDTPVTNSDTLAIDDRDTIPVDLSSIVKPPKALPSYEGAIDNSLTPPTIIIKPAPKKSSSGTIQGVLIEDPSKVYTDIVVRLFQNNEFKEFRGVSENRTFEFKNLTAGFYTLEVSQFGFESYKSIPFKVANDSITLVKDIKLSNRTFVEPVRTEHMPQKKPIIYFYPTKSMEVKVQLDYEGKLTHTYPKYTKDGWTVQAEKDGTLTDKLGKKYYALYWEGKTDYQFHLEKGFVVKGDETIDFLEDALGKLGLNRREANEFIIYWLPILEQNPYNLIHFSTAEYESMARLNITPTPETLIRVMMLFKPLDTPISIEKQDISALKKERKGFTVVEWGGQELPNNYPLR